VSITFDDADAAQADLAAPALESEALPATYHVIDEVIGKPGRTTIDDLARLRDAGASIELHAYAAAVHAATFPRLTPEELDRDLRTTLAWHVRNGFPTAGNLAYPSGAWDEGVEAIVRRYARTARTTFRPSSLGVGRTETFPAGEPLLRRAWSIHDDDPPADLIAAIDKAATFREHLELVFHDLTSGVPADRLSYRTEDFRAVVAHVAALRTAGAIDVRTPSDLYRGG
jgi:peptidoglycan/xylan/chitin deacetylase (PgdA/CDA1 family)